MIPRVKPEGMLFGKPEPTLRYAALRVRIMLGRFSSCNHFPCGSALTALGKSPNFDRSGVLDDLRRH